MHPTVGIPWISPHRQSSQHNIPRRLQRAKRSKRETTCAAKSRASRYERVLVTCTWCISMCTRLHNPQKEAHEEELRTRAAQVPLHYGHHMILLLLWLPLPVLLVLLLVLLLLVRANATAPLLVAHPTTSTTTNITTVIDDSITTSHNIG